MNLHEEKLKLITRRQFFRDCGTGVGSIALASLLNENLLATPAASADPLLPHAPHFAPKAKNIIYLHMAGAPSQLDLLDYKPKLRELNNQKVPEELIKNERFAFIKGVPKILGTPHRFMRHGQSGQEISAALPHLATVADEIAIVRSMKTDQFNHAPAQLFVHTGSARLGRPGMGAWLSYGLGTEGRNLPSFVVMVSGKNGPDGGASLWGSGFLPTIHQGVRLRSQGEPVLFLSNPEGMDAEMRRHTLDTIETLNKIQLGRVGDPETVTRIAQYEMAYRMQVSVPDLVDVSKEPASIHKLYGTEPGGSGFANNCLLARRLIERGTRFVQLYHWGWDSHGDAKENDIRYGMVDRCREVDQPAAALIKDLKQKGLLDQTLVVWGGEFGRTPMNEARNRDGFLGRDHHPHAFSIWMAGGGVKPGITYGATDELGYHAVENPVHVHDLQATILHLCGLDHKRLTYRFQGRDYRLTDVHGEVVKGLLA
ncbi:MAG: DUF1501 domain-containing protein [Verrucomicrobia bacterium]|nr:DUF1501 domain-containing protein [Verrucomicrobiota bacterium]